MKVNNIHHAEIILYFEDGKKITYPCIVDASFGVHKQPSYCSSPNPEIYNLFPELGTVHLEGTFCLGSEKVECE